MLWGINIDVKYITPPKFNLRDRHADASGESSHNRARSVWPGRPDMNVPGVCCR